MEENNSEQRALETETNNLEQNVKEHKSAQYTFGPEEKQILEILRSFESEIQEKLQESKGEVQRIKYYEKFQMNQIDFKNIFITTEKDAEGNISYHVYTGDTSNEIITIDKDKNVTVKEELEHFLGEIDLEKLIEENEKTPGRLKGISETATSEEMKDFIDGEEPADAKKDEKEHSEDEKSEQEKDENEEDKDENDKDEKGKDEETDQINKKMAEQGEDLELVNYKKIKDPHVAQRMPDIFGGASENGYAYSNKLHRHVLISTIGGVPQLNQNVEPAKMTWKTVISVGEDGKEIKRNIPDYIMQTKNPQEEIAVQIDYDGTIDLQTINVLPCQERIARGVRMQGEGASQEESLEVRQYFNNGGRENAHELAHQVQRVEQYQRENGETVDGEITEDSIVPNTEVTWGELMETTGKNLIELVQLYNGENTQERQDVFETMPKTMEQARESNIKFSDIPRLMIEAYKDSVSIKYFMEKIKDAEGSTLEDKINEAHDMIAQDYGAPTQSRYR